MRLNNEKTTLTNCVFASNSSKIGGAMKMYDASIIATNCTFFRNQASDSGGVIYSKALFGNYNSIRIRNSIFWDNRAAWWGKNIAILSDESSSTLLDIDFSDISTNANDLQFPDQAT